MHLLGIATKGDNEVFLADANLYMDFFGIVVVGWIWLKQGVVAKNALVTNSLDNNSQRNSVCSITFLKLPTHQSN